MSGTGVLMLMAQPELSEDKCVDFTIVRARLFSLL